MIFLENIDDVASLFNEAEDDNQEESYQMDDSLTTDSSDTNKETNTEPPNEENADDGGTNEEEDNQEESYQMDDSLTEDPSEGENGEEDTTEGENGEEDPSYDDGSNGETNEETTKKFILLKEYEEMYSTTNKLINNIEKLFENSQYDDSDDDKFIYLKLKELERKILFTIVNKFEGLDYQNLIKLYFLFQEQLSNITELFEKMLYARNKE